MLTGIHFLLTYKCTMECDHCFLFSGPGAKGTFTQAQILEVLDDAVKIGTIEWIFFEGGEPFMFYPILLEGTRLARKLGFKVGLVTNSYFATNEEDAELWLKPLHELGISYISISDDQFHSAEEDKRAKNAIAAAKELGMDHGVICIERPAPKSKESTRTDDGAVVGGGPQMKGRAVEKMAKDLPMKPFGEFDKCKDEELKDPKRVHIDPFGYVHICQGIVMGNIWETPLSELVKGYSSKDHYICGPLLAGGPANLARTYKVEVEERYASACHLCYAVRLALIDMFPGCLAPRQVYGLE